MRNLSASTLALLFAVAGFGMEATAQEALPAKFADDPVAKALGPAVFNAALKEGAVNWYGDDVANDFLAGGGKERFEKRFGIKLVDTTGRLRELTDRIRTEGSVARRVADVFNCNDQYMLELHALGFLEAWRPPAAELNNIAKEAFVQEPAGFWWPLHLSAQSLLVNTNLVKEQDIPKSYWDILDPKWKGKVGIRDPRSAGGGGWQFLHIAQVPGLGMDYLKKFKEAVNPFIISGGGDMARDAAVTGRFSLVFNGRGEHIRDLPKGSPVKFVVPKEGLAWTPASIAMIKGAPHPNAAKLLMTWIYEVPQIQLWSNSGRPIPHPAVKMAVPEMSVSDYPLMAAIPSSQLADPNAFFKEMEQVFGVR